jgi:hypothetical protein
MLPTACITSSYWIDDSTVVSPTARCNLFALVCDTPSPDQVAHLPGPPFASLRIEPSVHGLVFPRTEAAGQYGLFAVSVRDSSFRDLRFNPNPVGPAAIVPIPNTRLVAVAVPASSWLVELGTSPSGPSKVSVAVAALTDSAEAVRLPDLLHDGASVGVEACPPLVNPINGRTVGPDCTRIKARVKFEAFADGWLQGRVREFYEPVTEGDVAVVKVEGTTKLLHQQPWVVLKADNFREWTTPPRRH